jgi:hypothetical protein
VQRWANEWTNICTLKATVIDKEIEHHIMRLLPRGERILEDPCLYDLELQQMADVHIFFFGDTL